MGAFVPIKTITAVVYVAVVGLVSLALAGCPDMGQPGSQQQAYEGVYTAATTTRSTELTLVLDSEGFSMVRFTLPQSETSQDPLWTIVDGDVQATKSTVKLSIIGVEMDKSESELAQIRSQCGSHPIVVNRTKSVANDAVERLLTCLGSSEDELAEDTTPRPTDAILGRWTVVEDLNPRDDSQLEESIRLTVQPNQLKVTITCSVPVNVVVSEECDYDETIFEVSITVDDKEIKTFVVTKEAYYRLDEQGRLQFEAEASEAELTATNSEIAGSFPIYYTAGGDSMTWRFYGFEGPDGGAQYMLFQRDTSGE